MTFAPLLLRSAPYDSLDFGDNAREGACSDVPCCERLSRLTRYPFTGNIRSFEG